MVLVKLVNYMCKNETRSFSLILHKTQLQCIKDLNVRLDTLNLMEEEVGNILEHVGTRKEHLFTVSRSAKRCSHYGYQFGDSSKN